MLGILGCFASLTVCEPKGHLQLGRVRLYRRETTGQGVRRSSLQMQCPPSGDPGESSRQQ